MTGPRVLPVGDEALLVELAGPDETAAFHAEVLRRREAGILPGPVREVVPAAHTVLLDGLADPAAFAADVAGWEPAAAPEAAGAAVELPVRYDGPDLGEVARAWGMTPREAARFHAATEFRVAFCGFAPGFGYLTGLGERYAVPRRDTPRTAVPPGSVGVAGPYTGVYPRTSPGGWQLIGSTDAVLWDPDRDPPALLAPGTTVRFVAVEE